MRPKLSPTTRSEVAKLFFLNINNLAQMYTSKLLNYLVTVKICKFPKKRVLKFTFVEWTSFMIFTKQSVIVIEYSIKMSF